MKYPKYGTWCKENVIATIRRQKINDSKKYLEEFVFKPDSDLYSTDAYDYEIFDILCLINSDDLMSKSLFLTVQHTFDEEYFQMAQKINPQMSMKSIRNDGGDCSELLFETLDDITIDELKNAVMYAFDYGTEEIKASKIPYIKTSIMRIVKVIESDFVKVENASVNYIDPNIKKKDITTDKFIDYLMHLNQSGIFANTVKWRYTDLFDSGEYLLECDINHNNGYELIVAITVINKENRSKVAEILGRPEE